MPTRRTASATAKSGSPAAARRQPATAVGRRASEDRQAAEMLARINIRADALDVRLKELQDRLGLGG